MVFGLALTNTNDNYLIVQLTYKLKSIVTVTQSQCKQSCNIQWH
jgi:hypothetical protein